MKRTKVKCSKCGCEISKSNISRHEQSCQGELKVSYALTHDGLECQFCGKVCKNRNSLCNHERLCASNPNRQYGIGFTAYNEARKAGEVCSWNAGLTAETDERIRIWAEKLSNRYSTGELIGSFVGRHHTDSAKQKLRKIAIENGLGVDLVQGGYRYSKRGKYKGIICDSIYELVFLIYCLDHNISIKRNSDYFNYVFEGKTRRYYPDFYLPETATYIELKGYKDARVDIKLQSVLNSGNKIDILYKQDLLPYFEYVGKTYNKRFNPEYNNLEELYD